MNTKDTENNQQECFRFNATTGDNKKKDTVPVVFRKGKIPEDIFNEIKECWKSELKKVENPMEFKDRPWQGEGLQSDIHYKYCDEISCGNQGIKFEESMPDPASQFHKKFMELNNELIESIEKECKDEKFDTCGEKRPAFSFDSMGKYPRQVKDCVFSIPTLQKRWGGGSKEFHVDGGPSMIFLAITIEGERILEIELDDENGNPTTKKIQIKEGEFYLSSPSSFWHRVLPLEEIDSCTTLLFRSTVLKRRISGGREKEGRKRTKGMKYSTRNCFVSMANKIADIFEKNEIKWK